MGGKSSPPPAPDYIGAANAQGAANVDAARASAKLSNPNIITPYGTQTVSYEGDTPTVTQSYTPLGQKFFDQDNAIKLALGGLAGQGIGNVQDVLGKSFDTSGLPSAPINPGMTAQSAIMERLQPQIERERGQLQTQLSNQGIPMDSEAYKNAMTLQDQRENDLLSQAASQGIGLDQGARQQALSEQLQLRELPLNEVSSLMSGSQVSLPQFQGYQGAQAAAAPIFSANQAAGQYGTDVYNAKMASQSNMMGGLMGLGGSLGSAAIMAPYLAASDRRLKTDIKKIGQLPSGLHVYSFRYKWSNEKTIGVMADEVEQVFPEAVHEVNGFKAVDYSKVH